MSDEAATTARVRPDAPAAPAPAGGSHGGWRPPQSPGLVRQAVLVAQRDLKVEARAGEVALILLPFGATALLLVPLAVGADVPVLRTIAPGMYWTVVLVFGALVTARHSTREHPAHRDMLRLLGLDPAARFLAQTAINALLLAGLSAVLAPVVVALYDPPLAGWWWLFALIPLVAVGLGGLGGVAGQLTSRLSTQATLAPLIVVPLALPLLVAATQVVETTTYRASPLPWLVLLTAVDVVVVLAGLVTVPVLAAEEG